MGKILTKTGLLLLFSFLLFSCNEDGCTESTDVNMNVYFYSASTRMAFTFDSLSVLGIGQPKDSLLYNKSTSVKTLALPLHISGTTTAYLLNYGKSNGASVALSDTIRIFHQNRSQFISKDCGCSVFATIDSIRYTRHRLDTVIVVNQEITNQIAENVQIFY